MEKIKALGAYNKAYLAGGGVLASAEVAEALTDLVVWLVSLTGVAVPAGVQTSVGVLLAVGLSALVVYLVPNVQKSK